jgi:hypothetical protein
MWRSGWALVPTKDVPLVVDETNDADVEPWDYPWVGFPDGEVEGSNLNKLWSLVCGSPTGKTLWGPALRDAPDGCEKVAPVRPEAIEAFAGLSDTRIRELAAAWQQAESETGSLPWWKREDIVEAIRELKFLAQQERKLRPGWELLMVWFL